MVIPSIIGVTLYFLSMLTATVAAGLLLRITANRKIIGTEVFTTLYDDVWIKRSFIALFLYFLINLLAESVAWTCVFLKLPNYAVYSFNYALNLIAIFVFFAVHVNSRFFPWLLFVVYGGFIYYFVEYKMWLNEELIPFMFGVILFSGMAVVVIIFLAANLITHSKHPNWFKIQLGIIFLIYNFMALFVPVFMLDHRINGISEWYLFFTNLGLASFFYMGCGIVLLKLYKKQSYAG